MINVFITIDTECSMGGALNHPESHPVGPELSILGRISTNSYGTPYIMNVLEGQGLRGTFFLETLAAGVVDRQRLMEAYGEIVARGHDVQLHAHPVYYFYRMLQHGLLMRDELPAHPDYIGSFPLSVQLELLREANDMFQQLTGRTPIAFRAGCCAADDRTLAALTQIGIEYDSSLNAVGLGSTCLFRSLAATNACCRVGAVLEVPLTNFHTGVGRLRGFKPLNVAAVSYSEMIQVLNSAERCHLENVVFILHSFAFLKRKDVQFREMRPDRVVMARFEALCRYLVTHSDRFQVTTFGDRPRMNSGATAVQFPDLGCWRPVCRKFVQAVNRLYWI